MPKVSTTDGGNDSTNKESTIKRNEMPVDTGIFIVYLNQITSHC